MDERVIGIVVPISRTHAERILLAKKDVLTKYLSRVPRRREDFRLKKGMKVILYVTSSGRRVAGEAEIQDLRFLPLQETIERYHGRLVLTPDELTQYAKMQPGRTPSKPLLVLELKKVREYKDDVSYPRNVSMVGEYLRFNVYDELRGAILHSTGQFTKHP